MKYLTYWGLGDFPFKKEIQTKNLTATEDVNQVKSRVSIVKENGGICVITGKPGSGKTTILRGIVDELPPGLFKPVYLKFSSVKGTEFYRSLARNLGIEPGRGRLENFESIQNRISNLRTKDKIMPLIIVDEAQMLAGEILTDLPSLMNFEMDARDFAALVLCGTPSLGKKLNLEHYEALRDRVAANYEVQGPTLEETQAYVYDRLKLAGGNTKTFDLPAIMAAHTAAKGSLRRLNNILNTALIVGFSQNLSEISAATIQAAIEEMAL